MINASRYIGTPFGKVFGFKSFLKFTSASVDVYGINGVNPKLVFDFASEFYRTGGSTSTFDDSLTYTGASAKTMVDSDGLVKWAPHNLVTYSEQFDNAAWVKFGLLAFGAGSTANATTAPDGETTADLIVPTAVSEAHLIRTSSIGKDTQTQSFYVKPNGYTKVAIYESYGASNYAAFELSGGGSLLDSLGGGATATIEAVAQGFYKLTMEATQGSSYRASIVVLDPSYTTGSVTSAWLADGTSGIYLWGAHLYRSDLGGMVDNPDRGDSYVPTTSAAVYLPRRGHHIYNGSAWVNEGILLESEARTNLATYSSDLQAATDWDIFGTNSLTITSSVDANAIGSDGETSLYRVEITDTTSEAHGADLDAPFSAATNYTLSIAARAGEQQYLSLRLYTSGGSWATVTFDILNGTVTQEDVGSSGTVQDSGVINLGGGLYRCWFSGQTPSGSGSNYGFSYSFASVGTPTNSGGTEAYAGTSGDGCWLGEAQFEAGSTPSSYIPTAGATVTRAAETLTVAAANLPYSAVNMSMQMDGELTYADGGGQEAEFHRWYLDANNEISAELWSSGSLTGRVQLQQRAAGVTDQVLDVPQYTPGINVNFNYAARHGATFINTAIDGVTGTADLTPTALPDLSASNMLIAYDFMGTIGKFRMWDEDLGDTGIATASARTYTTEFAMIVATTTPSETFTIPCQIGTFNAGIDWGDGQVSTVTAFNDAALTHTYAAAGDHVIRITGTFPNIYFNNSGDKLKVKSVENLGEVGWIKLNRAFYGCSNMTSFTAGTTDTSAITSMTNMFNNCSSVTALDVSSFDTALVTAMDSMFFGCSSVTALDVSGFDTALVTSMVSMFRGCTSLTTLDVSSFNTALVTTMGNMFYNCSSVTTLDVSGFDTALVTNMTGMFYGCSSVTALDVSGFNTALVTDMSNMFRNCSSVTALDVSGFNTALVTNMSIMFRDCTSLTDIVGVDTFDIGGLNSTGDLTSFAINVTLPTARYDALLLAWEAQDPFDGMAPTFGSSTYTGGGAAATARASLISRDGWTITDGGIA